jgi:hypothetical protein
MNSTKKSFAARAAMTAGAFFVAAGLAGAQEPAPKMEIPVKDYSAGVVQKGQKVEYAFVIKNTGKAPLQILEAKPGCGCTVAEFDKEIAPGGTGRVKAVVDTTNFSYGEQGKSITVRTNDPVQPSVSLQLRVIVSAFVRVLPNDTVVFNAKHGVNEEKKVVLHAEDGTPFDVSSAASDSEYLKVSYKKVGDTVLEVEPGVVARKGDTVLTVKLDSGTPVGYLSGRSVTVKTTHPKMPEVKVKVSARVSAAGATGAASAPKP